MQENIELLVNEMSQKTGKNIDEINSLIDAKVEKFSGLLTKQGAAFMVQKELGLKKEASEEIKISELTDGMKNINVKGKIKLVFPQKEFERNGKTGKLSSFILEEDGSEIRVTLWNDQVDQYKLNQGSIIEINNAVVSSYNEKKQLSLGFNGNIDVKKEIPTEYEKINDLKGGMKTVNIYGRIIRKFPSKEFDSGEKKGKLCNFQFGDETDILRATAWNEKADEINNFNEGEIIEIKNAYTKQGMFGVELHLGYNTILNKSDKEVRSVNDIIHENTTEKTINQINENETVIIKGKIKEISNGNLYYLACEKCNKKVQETSNGVICEKCGEVKGKVNPVINLIIEDDTAEIKANFFGNVALNAINKNNEEFEDEINNKSNEKIVEELSEELVGKEIKILGYPKTNSYSGEFQFNTKEIIK